jgi:NAD+ synthase (glutamine-hydrolysing)
MRIGIAQIDSTAGDLAGNSRKIVEHVQKAKENACDLVVFPEMALTGYPVCDLAFEMDFLRGNKAELGRIARQVKGIAAIIGFIDFDLKEKGEDGTPKRFNAAALIKNKRVAGVQAKTLLPTYDVFDEKRFFAPSNGFTLFEVAGKKLGITICEDIWDENYAEKPVDRLLELGAELIVNISASPFHRGKLFERKHALEKHAKKGVPIVLANKVGVQDNGLDILVFDGQSVAMNKRAEAIAIGKRFEEQLLVFELDSKPAALPKSSPLEETLEALVFGVRGYAEKCGFSKAVLGLSGGIDSSVVACIAALALGKENVLAVSMPSRFSSRESIEDAKTVAKNLGIGFKEWPIEKMVGLNSESYAKIFGQKLEGTAAENPQARLRGNTLMTISNAQKRLLLGTGNKTEIALGYCTLYGDMAGGIEVIGDISKTTVYGLAEHINKKMESPIPKRVLQKAPSAELAPNQRDPFDYEKVSPLVDMIVQENKTKQELVETGFPKELVDRIKKLVESAQYKRKQAPPIIRLTKKAFGSGRIYPIINRWK